MVVKTKKEVAELLAQGHFQVEPNLRRVFILEPVGNGDKPSVKDDPSQPIVLLEVVEGTIERGIEPIAFTADPHRGIHYSSMIVEVSPNEFKAIENEQLDLRSRGWIVGEELKAG